MTKTVEDDLETDLMHSYNDMDYMLVVMRSALDSLQDDNDSFSAEAVLRTCLRKYNR